MTTHLMNTYARQPLAFVRGEGAWLWDEAGKRYLDAVAGVAVNGLGHGHPGLVKAIAEQAAAVIHTSNLYRVPRQEELADRLCALSRMDRVFFCNSGCEANEAAIKLARLYGHGKGIEVPTIIVMEKAFHGRTMATLTATGSRKIQAGFEPLLTGFARVPYNDIEAVRQVAEHNKSVVAVLLEVVQGEGGINLLAPDYLAEMRKICDAQGWLLMLDEVQTGIGRTGTWFGFQHSGVVPDVMALAKGLGSGVPIGACLARGAAAEVFKPGNHGSTFGGNPLACAAALATLDAIESEGLLQNAGVRGEAIRAGLREALAGVHGVVEIRGEGMMIGVELDRPCGELVGVARDAGVLINVTAERVIRLVPPLIYGDAEVSVLVDAVSSIVRNYLQQAA
ncbi:MAG: aspartate aminotransferase family protein [Hydrogenophilales bacterium 16-64-46]|nr:MAG: aspartate aminotransferase family protein [Hydrogenophilales bacterium 12-64-13]OYZ04777.1 MAG: aspartate aminotransferase family protein [Hydrogenophilales bacterium 16-64-46]OZA38463.1 MAG: aspartate aminotransferase family protein [Hydrogenophilales bacterium 17-64-34]HQT00112.1 acetylornithine transaminase [Thiobacillus sp.]